MTLPIEAARLIEQVVRAARLPPSQANRVRADLVAHFHDGLDRRVPVGELIASFGDPGDVASLIRAARPTPRRSLAHYGLAASIAMVAAYGLAFARVASFPASEAPRSLDAELAAVAAITASAEHALGTPAGVETSFEIARELTAAGSLWRRAAGVVLLETTLRAGDSVLSVESRRELLTRVEHELRRPVADAATVAEAKQALGERLLGNEGRMDQGRLRVLRLAKGVVHPELSARLLEPIYFSRGVGPAELHAMAEQLVRRKVAAAEQARHDILTRTRRGE
ncbi:MAG TPA: hypothetical protein VFM14_07780 [Gemmatimonadales bacterium]|nr:hypothetical protein [Gemmatimonadales bacterium]